MLKALICFYIAGNCFDAAYHCLSHFLVGLGAVLSYIEASHLYLTLTLPIVVYLIFMWGWVHCALILKPHICIPHENPNLFVYFCLI